MKALIDELEGFYEVTGDCKVISLSSGKVLKVYSVNGKPCVSIKGKSGIRRHCLVKNVISALNNRCTPPFDTGVDEGKAVAQVTRFATNAELVARQVKLIQPLLARNDADYLDSLSHLLAAGLGNRKVSG